MFRKVIGYTKDNRHSLTKNTGSACGKICAPTPESVSPRLLDFPMDRYVFEFAQEFFDILKIPVNGSEADVRDFVKRPQMLHQRFPDLSRRKLAVGIVG